MSSVSNSSRKVKVKWPQLDITVTAAMNNEANPDLVNLLYEHLPYRSLQNHALVSGDHLYHLVPSERLIVSTYRLDLPEEEANLTRLCCIVYKGQPRCS